MQTNIQHYPHHFKAIEKLSRYSKQELIQLRERNMQMLSKPAVISTLPDKGTKLKEINQIIENLLHEEYDDDIVVVQRLNDMTVLTPHQGARKRSVDLANQQAFSHYSSSRLLSKPKSRSHNHQPYPSIFHVTPRHSATNALDQAKVRMMTLDESMSLQEMQRSSVQKCDEEFDTNRPSQSLLKSLNLSMDVIQDVNVEEIEFPVTEEEEEEEGVAEEMIID